MSERYGAIVNGSHPVESRSVSRAENCTMDVQIVGDYNNLESIVRIRGVGDDASAICTNTEGDFFSGYKIKTLSVSRETGGIGVLTASLVKAGSMSDPYHVTYSVDMVEDQRTLLRHPTFKDKPAVMKIIREWNDTPLGTRVQVTESGEVKFYRNEVVIDKAEYDGEGNITKIEEVSVECNVITDETAIKYCKAVTAGIENYNVYLPVVSRTSLYLKQPPGLTQNDDTHKLSGTLEYSTNIGKWDDGFGFIIDGFETNEKQGWFKSKDSYTQNADGTWQRSEEWVFSDTKENAWIYEEAQ